jgi:hypothetical protein
MSQPATPPNVDDFKATMQALAADIHALLEDPSFDQEALDELWADAEAYRARTGMMVPMTATSTCVGPRPFLPRASDFSLSVFFSEPTQG